MLGQIRTQLVDVVADLTADNPLAELPNKAQVDAAVGQHIGTQYNTTISTNGPTAIGTKAEAKSEGLSVDDAIKLLEAVRQEAAGIPEDQRSELLAAVEELQAEAGKKKPDTGEVVKRAGRLRTVAARIGVPALSAAVGGAVEAFTGLAVGGAFS